MTIIHQGYEFVMITWILVIFRAREWPTYFNINLIDEDYQDTERRGYEPPKIAPIINANIDMDKSIDRSRFSSLGDEVQFIVLNPQSNDNSMVHHLQMGNRQNDINKKFN